MKYLELLKEQDFYIEHLKNTKEYEDFFKKEFNKNLNYSTIKETIQTINNYDPESHQPPTLIKKEIEFLRCRIKFLLIKYKFLTALVSENEKEYIEQDKQLTHEEAEHAKNLLNELLEATGRLKEDDNLINNVLNEIFKDTADSHFIELDEEEYIEDSFGGNFFDDLIKKNENSELANWYRYLQYMHESHIKDFTINRNIMSNFKIIFKDPVTGLYTDKENIVSLSYSTSKRKAPVFSIGRKTFSAHSYGVQLLAGSMVTLALENVPLPYLHAISLMDHASVTDLPALDMYIIPIENIGDTGLYEILVVKGIRFIETKQNDKASSTGVYYAFNFFAEDVYPINSSEITEKFKLTRKGNLSLI